jgi:CRP/FNR family transcriptional regulator, cyclic AMP receptor protein
VLTDDDRAGLEEAGRTARWRAGTVLFREGEEPGAVFLVLEGRVKVHVATAKGHEVLLAVKEPGELLGELAAIEGVPRSASATVLDDLSAVVVPAHRFCGRPPRTSRCAPTAPWPSGSPPASSPWPST